MQLEVGSILQGKVTGITKFGAFVDIGSGNSGMVHISEVASTFVKEITDYVEVGQAVSVKVLGVDEKGRVSLSMKQSGDPPQRKAQSGSAEQEQAQSGERASRRSDAPSGGRNNRPYSGDRRPQGEVRESSGNKSFDDMLSRFMQASDEKMSDLRKSTGEHRPRRNRRP